MSREQEPNAGPGAEILRPLTLLEHVDAGGSLHGLYLPGVEHRRSMRPDR